MSKKKFKLNLKNPFLTIAISILVLGILIVAVNKNATAPLSLTEQESTYLKGLAIDLKIPSPKVTDSMYYDWATINNDYLPMTGKEIITTTSTVKNVPQYNSISNDDLMNVNLEFLQPVMQTSNDYYKEQGFWKNETNTNTKPTQLGEILLAYDHGDIKCFTRLFTQADPFAYLFCGTIDQKQKALQQEFTPLFGKPNANKKTTFRVLKVEGSFSYGNAYTSNEPGGYSWIAKKNNGKWEAVYKGQEIPLCSQMKLFEVPKSIYNSCYNMETGKTE